MFDPKWADAIARIESGGKYDLTGPQTKSGDRAYGKYQVMGSNVAPWTQAALGTAMSPDQFLQDPKAQDAVFQHVFGQYADKYGPTGASKAWFAGERGMNNPNASDGATSVANYANMFNRYSGLSGPEDLAGAKAALGPQDDGTLPPGATPASFSPQALASAQAAMAPGATPGASFGNGLVNAGAALMSIYNPQGASALTSMAHTAMLNQAMMKPQWGVIKEDPYTGQKVYGFIDPMKMTTSLPNAQGGAGGASGAGTQPDFNSVISSIQSKVQAGAKPEDVIKSDVPGPLQGYVQSLLKGDAAPANMGRNATARSSAILMAHALDPNFNENVMPMRQAYAKGMASLSPQAPGGQVASSNTIVEHLASAYDHANALFNNGNYSPTDTLSMLNGTRLNIADQAGDPTFKQHYTAYQSDIKAISDELEKVLSGSKGAEASKQYWLKQLSLTNGPTAAYNSLGEVQRLMEGRLVPLAAQKQEAWGTPTTSRDLLNPSAQEKYDRVQKFTADFNATGGAPAPSASSAAAPAAQAPMQGAKLAPDGKYYVPDPQRPGKFLRVDQ